MKKSYKKILETAELLFLCAALTATALITEYYKSAVKTVTEANPEQASKTVVIDAGHGGTDGGASGYDGVTEKTYNLLLAQELKECFDNSGWNVVMTRTDDGDTDGKDGFHKRLDIQNRIDLAEQYPDAVFISLHLNISGSPKDHGFQVFYGLINEKSPDLALKIYDSVNASGLATRMRVVRKCYDTIYLQAHIHNPSVLVECRFMSNSADYDLIRDEEYRKKLMMCIYEAVCAYCEDVKG